MMENKDQFQAIDDIVDEAMAHQNQNNLTGISGNKPPQSSLSSIHSSAEISLNNNSLPRQTNTNKRKKPTGIKRIFNRIKSQKNTTAFKGMYTNDENTVRGNWTSHTEFLLSLIGYSVGLGNVWRFPYLCYKNGGGSFLVIYWILFLLVGFPVIFLELSLGQFTSQGPSGIYSFAPIVKGLGYSMCAISTVGAIYYNVIISWALYYLFASFRSQLMWSECDFSSWANYRCELPIVTCQLPNQLPANDGLCYTFDPFDATQQQTPRFIETFCPSSKAAGSYVPCVYFIDPISRNRSTVVGCWNERLASETNSGPQFSSEQFFFRNVLGQEDKVDDRYSALSLGPPQLWTSLCLLLSWVLVYLCLFNGIKSSGKVVYFTALFPYVVLSILIGRGVTLPGATTGILYFILPDFEKMRDIRVWVAACSQLYFSLGACWGAMTALSSYNKFHTNIFRDALIITAADTFSSSFASLAIFSVVGYGSHILNKPVDEVVDAGTGLVFILYPKIIDNLPGSVAFAILFFFMLLMLALDSAFNGLETIFTIFLDKFPRIRTCLKKKASVFAVFCTPLFLLGLPLVSPGGMQLLELVDEYATGWSVFFIAIVETLTMAHLYGAGNYAKDLSAMMPWLLNGRKRAAVVPWLLRVYWGFVTPGILVFIIIASWVWYIPRESSSEEALGWCISIFVMMWIPIMAVWQLFKHWQKKRSFWLALKSASSPSAKWGPYLDKHRAEVDAIHGRPRQQNMENDENRSSNASTPSFYGKQDQSPRPSVISSTHSFPTVHDSPYMVGRKTIYKN